METDITPEGLVDVRGRLGDARAELNCPTGTTEGGASLSTTQQQNLRVAVAASLADVEPLIAEIERLRREYQKRVDLPIYLGEVPMQLLSDGGLNPFAVVLFTEAYNGKHQARRSHRSRLRFVFNDVEVYLGPAETPLVESVESKNA